METLSDKRKIPFDCIPDKKSFYFYPEKDVKEKVKLLKEDGCGGSWTIWNDDTQEYDNYKNCRHDILCPKCVEFNKRLKLKLEKIFGDKLI